MLKEAIEEDLAEGYREMDARELKRLNKVFVAFEIYFYITTSCFLVVFVTQNVCDVVGGN